MRPLLPALLVPALVACESSPAGSARSADALAPPTCVLAAAAEPVAIHPFDPETGVSWGASFGACGHLLVHDRFAAPDLAALDAFPDGATGYAQFSPTGEWLAVDDWSADRGESHLVELATGHVFEFGDIRHATVFVPRRWGEGSYVVHCGPAGLSVFDGQEERQVAAAPVGCDERLVAAAAAPVVVFAGAEDRLFAADLEGDTVVELPFDAPPRPRGGVNVGRNDLLHVSPDGTVLLHQRVDEFEASDYSDDVPEPRVSLVDLRTGELLGTHPASEGWPVEPVDLPGRGHGFFWTTEGRTFAVAPDRSVLELGVDVGRLVWAGASGAIGQRFVGLEEAGWVRLDFGAASWKPLASGRGDPAVSADGRLVATVLPTFDDRSRIDGEGAAPREVSGAVQWIGNDGTTLVLDDTRTLDGYRLVLRDPAGAERAATLELGTDRDFEVEVRAVPGALVALAAGHLFVFDLAGGEPRKLASHVTSFRLDPSGRRLAYQVEQSPNDRTSDLVLFAGRVAP